MATEVNQPSYIISNSDDVDDVIVRPITHSNLINTDLQSTQPKVQAQSPTTGAVKPPEIQQRSFAPEAHRASPPKPIERNESPANGIGGIAVPTPAPAPAAVSAAISQPQHKPPNPQPTVKNEVKKHNGKADVSVIQFSNSVADKIDANEIATSKFNELLNKQFSI